MVRRTLRPRTMPKPPDPSSRKRAASPASIASHSTTTDVLSGIGRLEEQLKEIKTQLSEEREARRRMEERLLVAQAEKDAALDTVARLQRAVESMQREMRSNNIIIYGVPESPEDSGTTVKALLSSSALPSRRTFWRSGDLAGVWAQERILNLVLVPSSSSSAALPRSTRRFRTASGSGRRSGSQWMTT